MKNQMGGSMINVVLKMMLIAFVSLLAFSSGVYFGKQLSDSDYQLKALESDFNHSTTRLAENKDYELGPDDVIAEEEVAALSEKFVNSERETAKPAAEVRRVASASDIIPDEELQPSKDHSAKKHEAHAAKPDLSAVHKAAARVANNAAPVDPKESAKAAAFEQSRVPNSLPKTVGASQDVEFTVQVASYPTMDAAKDRAGELVKQGYPAFPVEATVNGKTWYRVSVGSFKTLKEANDYRAQFLKQTNLASAIVQRIQR
jgi:DedD protein